jgi:hypothetical protein
MNFVVKNPGPWGGLGTCHEGSMFLSAPQKYVRQTREPESATGERIFRPMADFVAKVENRMTAKISQELIFGLLCCCIVLQRHY